MKELSSSETVALQYSSCLAKRLKNTFYSFECIKVLAGCCYHSFKVTVNQDLRVQDNCMMDKELEEFDRMLKECKERQFQNFNRKTPSVVDTEANPFNVECQDSIVMPTNSTMLQNLQDQKVNLVLVATSLDEKVVVNKLKDTLDPAKSSMIPLSIDNKANYNANCNGSTALHGCPSHSAINGVVDGESNEHGMKNTTPKRVDEKEKNERYWKRRTSNNEAAKKSRDARKQRFEWIENRTKELEAENESLREQLATLKKQVSEKEEKGKS